MRCRLSDVDMEALTGQYKQPLEISKTKTTTASAAAAETTV